MIRANTASSVGKCGYDSNNWSSDVSVILQIEQNIWKSNDFVPRITQDLRRFWTGRIKGTFYMN